MNDDAVLAALDALIAGFAAPEPHPIPQEVPHVAPKRPRDFNLLKTPEPQEPHPGGIPPTFQSPTKDFQNLYTSGSESPGRQTQGVQVDVSGLARAQGLSPIDVALVALAPTASPIFSDSATFARSRRECMWHLAHGERLSFGLCAGCRRPIRPGEIAWRLADDNSVHIGPVDDPGAYDCLIAHGGRWRAVARAATEPPGD